MQTINAEEAVAKKNTVRLRGHKHDQHVPISWIVRLEGDHNYSIVHFRGGSRLLVSRCLKEMEEQLPEFLRVHKSHLVNPIYIRKSMVVPGKDGELIMQSGLTLPVARRRAARLLSYMTTRKEVSA